MNMCEHVMLFYVVFHFLFCSPISDGQPRTWDGWRARTSWWRRWRSMVAHLASPNRVGVPGFAFLEIFYFGPF